MTDEGRISRSWRLTKEAAVVLRRSPAMCALGATSAVISVAAVFAIFVLSGWFADHGHHGDRFFVIMLVASWPLTFVGTYFNVALAAAAAAALDDRAMGIGEALGVASRRIGTILGWSLLASAVGIVIHQLIARIPFGGRVISWVTGIAWGLATFFVVPVIALEGTSPIAAAKRSGALIRGRWGEGVAGSVIITAWMVVVSVPAGVCIGVGIGQTGSARVALIAAGVTLIALTQAVGGALRQVFAVALYRFAAGEGSTGPFGDADLQQPFAAKRRRLI